MVHEADHAAQAHGRRRVAGQDQEGAPHVHSGRRRVLKQAAGTQRDQWIVKKLESSSHLTPPHELEWLWRTEIKQCLTCGEHA